MHIVFCSVAKTIHLIGSKFEINCGSYMYIYSVQFIYCAHSQVIYHEHFLFQKLISITLEKFGTVSAKDGLKMSASLEEIAFRIQTQFPSYKVDMKKLRQRVLKTLEWQRYYSKKRYINRKLNHMFKYKTHLILEILV